MRTLALPLLLAVVVIANAADVDLAPIDSYLAMWDRFAQGEESLVPKLNETVPAAHDSLVKALAAKDPRAPSRLVFLMIVKVGGSVPVDSKLGRAWRDYVGNFPVTKDESEDVYFAADFYFWWKRHQSPQHDLPLLREWLTRDFARTTVIPMYEGLSKPQSR